MTKLTKQQIERQDFVDNEIFGLLQRLSPKASSMEWNIEAIGAVRDTIQEQIVNKQPDMSEMEFYP
jgi:hypothetical protein